MIRKCKTFFIFYLATTVFLLAKLHAKFRTRLIPLLLLRNTKHDETHEVAVSDEGPKPIESAAMKTGINIDEKCPFGSMENPLVTRYEQTGNIEYLQEAISLAAVALGGRSDGQPTGRVGQTTWQTYSRGSIGLVQWMT